MRLRHIAPAVLAALMLAGCAAPSSSPSEPNPPNAPDTPAGGQAPTPAAPATPATPAAPAAPPVAEAPGAAEAAPGPDASAPGRSCKVDGDCAVKDVGNCCGAFPTCVNKHAKTDPAAVRAQCAREGMASVCGFQDVSGCQCVKGQCENVPGGGAVM